MLAIKNISLQLRFMMIWLNTQAYSGLYYTDKAKYPSKLVLIGWRAAQWMSKLPEPLQCLPQKMIIVILVQMFCREFESGSSVLHVSQEKYFPWRANTVLHSVVLSGRLLYLRTKGKKNQVNRSSAHLLKALIHDFFKEWTKGWTEVFNLKEMCHIFLHR